MLFREGIVDLCGVRAEAVQVRLPGAGQPFATAALVRARRAGPRHIALGFDGQLGGIDAEPGQHSVQLIARAGTSGHQGLDLRAHQADIGQHAVEGAHCRKLRELALQLPALACAFRKTGNRLLHIVERRHDPYLRRVKGDGASCRSH